MESKLDRLKSDRAKRRVPRSRSAKPVAVAVVAVPARDAAGFVLARDVEVGELADLAEGRRVRSTRERSEAKWKR